MEGTGSVEPMGSSRPEEGGALHGATRAGPPAEGRSSELATASSARPPVPCLLHVCGLPDGDAFGDGEVRRLLEACGNVLEYRRARNPLSDKLLSFCSCTFSDVHGASRCVQILDGQAIGKAVLSVEMASGAKRRAGEGE